MLLWKTFIFELLWVWIFNVNAYGSKLKKRKFPFWGQNNEIVYLVPTALLPQFFSLFLKTRFRFLFLIGQSYVKLAFTRVGTIFNNTDSRAMVYKIVVKLYIGSIYNIKYVNAVGVAGIYHIHRISFKFIVERFSFPEMIVWFYWCGGVSVLSTYATNIYIYIYTC